jgi:hypothetical protein
MFKKSQVSKRRSDDGRRDAVAVVELAVCLPVLVVLLVATIESCVMLQLQQNLAVTAYEGARVGIIPGMDAGTVEFQCQLLLDDRNINAYTITLDPVDPQTMSMGDEFTVTIDADCAANSVIGGMFFDGKAISESVVMRAE